MMPDVRDSRRWRYVASELFAHELYCRRARLPTMGLFADENLQTGFLRDGNFQKGYLSNKVGNLQV